MVQSGGVARAIAAAVRSAAKTERWRAAEMSGAVARRQRTPIKIMERPRMLRMSTRRRSVQGAEAEDFRAAEGGLAGDGVGSNSLLTKFFCDEGEGDASEKNEEWGWEGATELRPFVKPGVAQGGTEPRVVAMSLEHEQAG